MGDKMTLKQEKELNPELKKLVYLVSSKQKLFVELYFESPKEAEKAEEKIRKLYNFEVGLVRTKIEGNKLLILPGLLLSHPDTIEHNPTFETGAQLQEELRKEFIKKWSELRMSDQSIGFYPIFVGEHISMVYLYLTEKAKGELETFLSEHNLGLEEVVKGEGIYKLVGKEEGKKEGGIMEMKVEKKEVALESMKGFEIGPKIEKIISELENVTGKDPSVQGLINSLKNLKESERKIIDDILPRLLGIIEGYNRVSLQKIQVDFKDKSLQSYVFLKSDKFLLTFEKDWIKSNTILNIVNLAKNDIIYWEGRYQQLVKDFKEFENTVQTVISLFKEYRELKIKYDQAVENNRKLEADIKVFNKINPAAAKTLKNQLNIAKGENEELKKKLAEKEKEVAELKAELDKYKQLFSTQSQDVKTKFDFSQLQENAKYALTNQQNSFMVNKNIIDKSVLTQLENSDEISFIINNSTVTFKVVKKQNFIIFEKKK